MLYDLYNNFTCIYIWNTLRKYNTILHFTFSEAITWVELDKLTPHIFFRAGIVRDQALHALGDGSPGHLEERIVEAIEHHYNDPFPDVKKKARRMMKAYRKNGKWNVL